MTISNNSVAKRNHFKKASLKRVIQIGITLPLAITSSLIINRL